MSCTDSGVAISASPSSGPVIVSTTSSRRVERLNLTEYVTFTGRIPDADVSAILSTADVGISPDPKNPLNDVSTMNKTMEYMAFALPVVAFDLRETRISAGDAAVYATPNDVGRTRTAAGRSDR